LWGQLVGATPWKQQLMLGIGVITAALVIPFILQTTFIAYRIENILPRLGMDLKQTLPAPQATLMVTITKGVFVGKLPFFMVKVGMVLAIIAIILDGFLRMTKSTIRFSVLLFALGIYLPLGYITAFLVGGNHSSFNKRWAKDCKGGSNDRSRRFMCVRYCRRRSGAGIGFNDPFCLLSINRNFCSESAFFNTL
jgi:putative OPT family oligopeptide transporter